jgi:L-threonylcarbamoyladenylate synthase
VTAGGADAPARAALKDAVAALRRGEVVAFPTESSYGLAVDALDPRALARLFALKDRDPQKPPPILVADERMAARLLACVPERAERWMARFWPGPLTLVLPARAGLPESIVSPHGVGIRRSPHPIADALTAEFGGPLTASSANRSGSPPARTAAEVRVAFPSVHIVDGGPAPGALPSTVVAVAPDGAFTVLRVGPLDPARLSE